MNLMLDFADLHKIVPWVETGPLDLEGIQQGVDRLRKGLTKYRYFYGGPWTDQSRFVAVAHDAED